MKPAFKITANGSNITELVADRLIDLSVTDEAGVKSDKLTIELDDRDQLIEIPSKGAELSVALGWEGSQLVELGTYIVDEVEVTGGPRTMSIRASATDFNGSISSQKERSWHDTTLGKIARTIAGEHDLTPVVSAAMDAVAIAHADQNESDIQFLTRLAANYGGVIKTPEGKLVLAERGRTKAVSGAQIQPITIKPTDESSWAMTTTGRGSYEGVRAYYHDKGKAKRTGVVAGKHAADARILSMSHTYANASEAQAAAEAKLSALDKGESKLSIRGLIGNPAISAEQEITVEGFRNGVDGKWVITKVEHKVGGNSAFITDIECELTGKSD